MSPLIHFVRPHETTSFYYFIFSFFIYCATNKYQFQSFDSIYFSAAAFCCQQLCVTCSSHEALPCVMYHVPLLK